MPDTGTAQLEPVLTSNSSLQQIAFSLAVGGLWSGSVSFSPCFFQNDKDGELFGSASGGACSGDEPLIIGRQSADWGYMQDIAEGVSWVCGISKFGCVIQARYFRSASILWKIEQEERTVLEEARNQKRINTVRVSAWWGTWLFKLRLMYAVNRSDHSFIRHKSFIMRKSFFCHASRQEHPHWAHRARRFHEIQLAPSTWDAALKDSKPVKWRWLVSMPIASFPWNYSWRVS